MECKKSFLKDWQELKTFKIEKEITGNVLKRGGAQKQNIILFKIKII